MANIDVIALLFDSFELMRAHYHEVAVSLAALLLLSGAGYVGGSSVSNGFGSGQGPSLSNIDNALSGEDGVMAELTGVLLFAISIVVAMAFAMAVLSMAIWYYVIEHFYAILNKTKIAHEWPLRMMRQLPKALVMALLDVVLLVAFADSIAVCLFVVQISWVAAAVLFLIVLIFWLNTGFYFVPVWAYYVLDNLSLFDAISRSIALVGGNSVPFTVFAMIFVILNIAALAGSMLAGGFAFISMPFLMVFITFLWRVTLIKMKMAADKRR